MNGIQIIKKGEGYFAPKNKLTNICEKKNLRCNECDGFLRHSTWDNIVVFYSITKRWFDGFLCVRCLDGIVTHKQLDNFVRKQNGGKIPTVMKRK
jgi:hypothetical protein